MSLETLSERLTALQESNAHLEILIERLAKSEFHSESIPLDIAKDEVFSELVADILIIINEQEHDLELLLEEVADFNCGRAGSQLALEKASLVEEVRNSIGKLTTYQSNFRRAQLTAKRKLEAAQKEERLALTRSYLENPTHASKSSHRATSRLHQVQKSGILSKEEKEINASSDITAALRRTHNVMAEELSRSQFAHDTLKDSTMALSQLSETYSTLDTMLSTSKNLLNTLVRSQKSDTWYLETSFYVLLITICWLIFRRIFYGPMLWFFWYPMRMFLKGMKGVLNASGLDWF